ncbi:hypothetical protein SEA_AMOCHICK_67 [Mycobacterium phage Amochick]|uniref:Uncharacterized protein n=1 Tax=Mycobacterium phage Amochick TaxID=2301540 RepID=A0A385D0Y1_9CAUD|nr:hypothetical protein SEA_AMOCHICK_67 [Mycobacterium phage Amochick]
MTLPVRVSVYRIRCGVVGPYVWIAQPHRRGELTRYETRWYGRRQITMSVGTVLAATWAEAIAYAVDGVAPRRIDTLPEYQAWCGL